MLPLFSTAETVKFVRGYEFFTPIDIMATFLGLAILTILAYIRRRNFKDDDYYKYYIRAFFFKLLFTYANAAFYIIAYNGGGDSIAFWDGAVKLNNLFFEKPISYFDEMWNNYPKEHVWMNFNSLTGYPDGRVYEEKASFFVSKIASVFGFFSFKGYILMSLIFAYITTNASWRLYELVRGLGLHSDWQAALAILFIPSLSFWCGGISKDTLMWVCTCYFIVNLYKLLDPQKTGKIKHFVYLILCLYVFYRVRSFMILTVTAPLLLTYASYTARIHGNSFRTGFIRFMSILTVLGGILVFFQTSIAQEFLAEAQVIYEDMTTNKTYGDKRYNLGEITYTPLGMLAAFPLSVVAGFYRPFIFEALNVSLILNGIESTILIYYTIRFVFRPKVVKRFRQLMQDDFLVYAFSYALILAFFAGFTSILFGVLIRFKAPVLPFLVLVLLAKVRGPAVSEEEQPSQGVLGGESEI